MDGKAAIYISDDGGGILDEMKSKIFDMFYSGANKIADNHRSLGVRLSLCKSIVNAHDSIILMSNRQSIWYGIYIHIAHRGSTYL